MLIDRNTLRVLFTILLFGVCLAFLWLAWHTLLTFLFAILFAYLWEPVIPRLQRRLHLTRGRAVAVIYVGIGVGVLIFLTYVSPNLARQAAHLATVLPKFANTVANGQIAKQIGNQRGWSWETQQHLQQFLIDHRGDIEKIENSLMSELAMAAGYLPWVALVPILAVFFMVSGARMQQALLRQISLHQRSLAAGVLADLHQVLASYIRAQIVLTAIAGVTFTVGFLILRVPYAVALAAWAGMLEFIPIIGPLAGFITVVLTAFLFNYPHLVVLIVFLGAFRVVQDYVNSPRIMGGQVQLDPLAVLFGVLVGGEIAGVVGVYLSVPVMASLRVIWRRWRDYNVRTTRALRGD